MALLDAHIREAIMLNLLSDEDGNSDVVVEELAVCNGRARVDLSLINGALHGFEIKSEADSLKRLKTQSVHYSAVLDYVSLVAAPKHIESAAEIVPDWWGIIEVEDASSGVQFRVVRDGEINPDPHLPSIVQLLWRSEMEEVISNYFPELKVTRWNKREISEYLGQNLSRQILSSEVRRLIKSREDWRLDQPLSGYGD